MRFILFVLVGNNTSTANQIVTSGSLCFYSAFILFLSCKVESPRGIHLGISVCYFYSVGPFSDTFHVQDGPFKKRTKNTLVNI